MTLAGLLRFGLRHFASGTLSVLVLGILNRIMKVEMGLDLAAVGLMVGVHYFAAAVAIPVGHRSDGRPYFGLHRTPYILAGTVLTSLTTALAPFVALFVDRQDGSVGAVLLGGAFFLVMGAGMYVSGTAYLSLLVDLTSPEERGKAVSIVWAMLMAGILAGVALGVRLMGEYTPAGLVTLFAAVAGLLFLLTVVAVAGQERRSTPPPSAEAIALREAVVLVTRARQARLFFGFLFSGILFLFMQQAVLEPFGGDVFGMTVRQTTLFNAFQMAGVLSGMGVAGAWAYRRLGARSTAGIGLVVGTAAFGLLAASALSMQAWLVRPAIALMGVGMGFFNVGGLPLMMGMAAEHQTGLYMGAWTLAQALANGLATVGGGVMQSAGLALLGDEALAYALVFAAEAGGLAVTWSLLQGVNLAAFRQEARTLARGAAR